MAKKILTGVNIQYPISQLILNGKKTIETRTYPIPAHYLNQEMVLVETPGKDGKFKSRAIAVIKFGESFKYQSKKDFYSDTSKHCVTPDSIWKWDGKKEKWGWPVLYCKPIKSQSLTGIRLGIKFTKNLHIIT